MTSAAETPSGLTSEQAAERLARYGPNAIPEEHEHPLRALWSKLSAPVPWMLEVTIVLELLLHRNIEATVIAVLLLFNAALSFVQESHARAALALLRKRLAIQARVNRDGVWHGLPARSIVPGDVIYLRVGDVIPADVRLTGGNALIDHSAVTGESAPVDAAAGTTAYAGGIVKRGEASAIVTATGTGTYFGRTVELVRSAKSAGHLQRTIFTIVKYLVAFDVALATLVLTFALVTGMDGPTFSRFA